MSLQAEQRIAHFAALFSRYRKTYNDDQLLDITIRSYKNSQDHLCHIAPHEICNTCNLRLVTNDDYYGPHLSTTYTTPIAELPAPENAAKHTKQPSPGSSLYDEVQTQAKSCQTDFTGLYPCNPDRFIASRSFTSAIDSLCFLSVTTDMTPLQFRTSIQELLSRTKTLDDDVTQRILDSPTIVSTVHEIETSSILSAETDETDVKFILSHTRDMRIRRSFSPTSEPNRKFETTPHPTDPSPTPDFMPKLTPRKSASHTRIAPPLTVLQKRTLNQLDELAPSPSHQRRYVLTCSHCNTTFRSLNKSSLYCSSQCESTVNNTIRYPASNYVTIPEWRRNVERATSLVDEAPEENSEDENSLPSSSEISDDLHHDDDQNDESFTASALLQRHHELSQKSQSTGPRSQTT